MPFAWAFSLAALSFRARKAHALASVGNDPPQKVSNRSMEDGYVVVLWGVPRVSFAVNFFGGGLLIRWDARRSETDTVSVCGGVCWAGLAKYRMGGG